MPDTDIDPNPLGEGVPAVMGGEAAPLHATKGAPLPGAMGRPHAHPSLQDTALATVENDYAITLEKENGDRKTIETIIEGGFSPTREHSALSDWTAVVPAEPVELEDWTFDTRMWITWDGQRIFQGYCKDVATTEKDAETVLHGYGPGIELDTKSVDAEHSIRYRNKQVWRAFEDLFEQVAPEWTAHVTRPPNPLVIDGFTVSGNPIECIEQLADEFNWHFLIDQSRWRNIFAFKPGTFVETASWRREDSEREKATENYYNGAIIAAGNAPDFDAGETWGTRPDERTGEQITAEYVDEEEIEEHAARREISIEEARRVKAFDEPDIASQGSADALARARTEEGIANADVQGSIDVFPRMIDPGKAYPTHWDDESQVGAYSLFFDGSSDVELPTRLFAPLTDTGGFAMWVRADWDDVTSAPLLGSDTLTISNPDTLTLSIGGSSVDAVPAGTETFASDEWVCIHYDWDTDDGEARAGYNGIIRDTASIGSIDAPSEGVWLGADESSFFDEGYIDYPQVFAERPETSHYEALHAGADIPARLIRARYTLREGPNQEDDVLYDAYGGRHGEINGAEFAGSPKILESVSYSHGPGTADCTLQFRKDRSTIGEVERLKRDFRLQKRRRS